MAAVVVVAVAGALVLLTVRRSHSPPVADGWPIVLKGTWVSTDGMDKLTISTTATQAVLVMEDERDGSLLRYTFEGDTLTADFGTAEKPMTATRDGGPAGNFIGDYDRIGPSGSLRIVMQFSGGYSGAVLTMKTRGSSGESSRFTWTFDPAANTLTWDKGSGTPVVVLARQ